MKYKILGNMLFLFSEIQNTDPTIEIFKDVFNVGDILDATCTSGPSKPVPEITWLVNGRRVICNKIFIVIINKLVNSR